jgi:Cysteine-rich CPXCG
MKILFLHGWHSVVGGVKPTYLKGKGFEVINPKLDDDDFEAALQVAQENYDLHQPDVIVGSSRGGALAININSKTTPLVLLCPAWKNWGTAHRLKPNSLILHSRNDDVIPFEDSEELVARSGLPQETLVEVGSDHRLADDDSLAAMLWACNSLSANQLPWTEDELRLSSVSSGRGTSSQNEGSYVCDACGETIVIPLDLTEGGHQKYVEDCPVCCRSNVIHVEIDTDGNVQVWAEPEQDYN